MTFIYRSSLNLSIILIECGIISKLKLQLSCHILDDFMIVSWSNILTYLNLAMMNSLDLLFHAQVCSWNQPVLLAMLIKILAQGIIEVCLKGVNSGSKVFINLKVNL